MCRSRTEKVWAPALSEAYACGELQGPKEPESSLHSKVDPDSVELNEKLADVEVVVPEGPDPIVVSGGVVSGGGVEGAASTDHASLAGVASTFPAASVARTEKLCPPTFSPVYALGEPQERQRALSSLHSNFDPDSVEVKANVAAVAVVVAGGWSVRFVSGGVESQARRRQLVDVDPLVPIRNRCCRGFDFAGATVSCCALGEIQSDRAAVATPTHSENTVNPTRRAMGSFRVRHPLVGPESCPPKLIAGRFG
jgi:hypothetical protein